MSDSEILRHACLVDISKSQLECLKLELDLVKIHIALRQ